MSDDKHAVYYFPPVDITAGPSNLSSGRFKVDYPKGKDVVIRYNKNTYYCTSIEFVADISGSETKKYLVYHTQDQNENKYDLAISIREVQNASANSLSRLVALASATTSSTVTFNLNAVYAHTATPRSYSNGKTVVSVLEADIPVPIGSLLKITSDNADIPFGTTFIDIALEQGTPRIEMDCRHRGDDMSKMEITKKTMSDKDIMQMITINLTIFIGLMGTYAASFKYLYESMAIGVIKKFSEKEAEPALGYVNLYWIITLVFYAFIALIYGLRANNGEFTTAGIFFFIILAVSTVLKSANEDFSKIKTGGIDVSAITGNKVAFGGIILGVVSIVTCGILGFVASFGKLGIKEEEAFVGTSTALIVGAAAGYGIFAAGAMGKKQTTPP
jgi:hypothetical protein